MAGEFGELTQEERVVLRRARRKPASERTEEERFVLRRYWVIMRQRSDAGLPKEKDLRENEIYREWLKKHGYSVRPFNRDRWNQFLAEVRLEE